ncbi:GDSL-type esterase/lipase family protein [Roseateles asaccharophilus]|uniref:Lysophospholipase L1-like esterase n=1 Tax=Roseateles asaccharophilus TaxID=582607 RepID=A0ABU2AFB3_9BURK|nr:GDSL-type esterase/lipase family protein [Roseateles asaccharophilus]MDR7335903.1 lysophospholipase L1-like esterase [Roseateles asaccharophilus]
MKKLLLPLVAAGLCLTASAQTAPAASAPRGETTANVATGPRLILVGDSTMAPRSGYGNALCARFQQVACINLARGGRSSMSFRAEGLWSTVMALLNEGGAAKQKTLVLIQFGHNDQPGKPGRSTDLATEFGPNMAGYVKDVKAAGGDVLLMTPLTRRTFKAGELPNDLRPWAEAIIKVGAEQGVPVLDVNAISHAAVAAMGQAAADTLAEAPPRFDRTHVGPRGAAFFSEQVMEGLIKLRPELATAKTLVP